MEFIQINYKPVYKDALFHFKTFFDTKEYSEESFSATETLLNLNASFYAAWKFRREILATFNSACYFDELDWTREMCLKSLKSFQVWYHRQEIVMACMKTSFENIATFNLLDELDDLDEEVFTLDAKNYHAWSYRIWLVSFVLERNENELQKVLVANPSKDEYFTAESSKAVLFSHELCSSKILIDEDPYNNSAWNFRFFLFSKRSNSEIECKAEIKFVADIIKKFPENEASWNYLKGICKLFSVQDLSHLNLPLSMYSPALSLEERAVVFKDWSDSNCYRFFGFVRQRNRVKS